MNEQQKSIEAARLSEQRARKAQAQYGRNPQKSSVPFTSDETLAALKDNEHGDARLVIKALKGRFVIDKQEGRAYKFNGYWRQDKVEEIFQEARRVTTEAYSAEAAKQYRLLSNKRAPKDARNKATKLYSELASRINQLNSLARMKKILELSAKGKDTLALSGEEWDDLDLHIQTLDTVINLQTGQGRPGKPEDYIRTVCPVKWQGLHAECPTWEKAFSSMFLTEETARYMHKAFGAALLGHPLQEFYLLCGEGENGKTTLLETIKLVIGPLAGSVRKEMLLETRNKSNGADPELLSLRGKRVIWTSETGKRKKLDIETIKNFTGADTLSGRFNYQNDIIEFKPQFTTFILTNFPPIIETQDHGTWRRIRFVKMPFVFVHNPTKKNERPKIPDLENKRLLELPGILAWLIRGCLLYQQEGLTPPPEIIESTQNYKFQEDIFGQFIEDCCVQGGKAQAGPLQDAFKEWFADQFGKKASPPGGSRFKEGMLNYCTHEGKRHKYYIGISLRNTCI